MEIQYPLTGGPEEKLTACLKAAGWYEGREVSPEKMKQITDFYASGGIALPEGAKNFIREFHGLAEGWYLNLSAEKFSWYPPHTLFKIFPDNEAKGLDYPARLDREDDPAILKENLEMMCDLAGEPVVWIGIIGYKYPVRIYMGSSPKIFVMSAWYDTADFSSLTEMMMSAFVHHPEWSFVTMRQIYDQRARPIPPR
ncbi:MAG: SUKH-3 domain-containing protein [Ruminococcus sp.]|nr:SUKH-3 domain-containing protein [Ruminococcus sp.]